MEVTMVVYHVGGVLFGRICNPHNGALIVNATLEYCLEAIKRQGYVVVRPTQE